jgi:hypothetical protein
VLGETAIDLVGETEDRLRLLDCLVYLHRVPPCTFGGLGRLANRLCRF